MLKIILVALLLICRSQTFSQVSKHGPPCGGMNILDVGLHVSGQKPIHGDYFYNVTVAQLKKGFTIALSDTSYRLVWLLVSHATNDKVFEYPISGNIINRKNAKFPPKIQAGDKIIID